MQTFADCRIGHFPRFFSTYIGSAIIGKSRIHGHRGCMKYPLCKQVSAFLVQCLVAGISVQIQR